jgi:predicted nucleic acid-binding protein
LISTGSGRTWRRFSTRIQHHLSEPLHARGIIDTSVVVIDLERIDPDDPPTEVAVSAATLAELAAGPHATADPSERARRQDRLQRGEATFDAVHVDGAVARAYGRVYAAVADAVARRRIDGHSIS